MKMYHFNPNSWGCQYFLAAESRFMAHQYLVKYLEDKTLQDEFNFYGEELKIWRDVSPNDPTTFPSQYTLDEHEIGEIVEAEVS